MCLADKPHPDVAEDTVMPDLVHEYVKGRDAVAALHENFRRLNTRPDGSVDDNAVRELLAAAVPDGLREGVAKTWTLGMRECAPTGGEGARRGRCRGQGPRLLTEFGLSGRGCA